MRCAIDQSKHISIGYAQAHSSRALSRKAGVVQHHLLEFGAGWWLTAVPLRVHTCVLTKQSTSMMAWSGTMTLTLMAAAATILAIRAAESDPSRSYAWDVLQSVTYKLYNDQDCQNERFDDTVTPGYCHTVASQGWQADVTANGSKIVLNTYAGGCVSYQRVSTAIFGWHDVGKCINGDTRGYSFKIQNITSTFIPNGTAVCKEEALYFERSPDAFAKRLWFSSRETAIGGADSFEYTQQSVWYTEKYDSICARQNNNSNVFMDLTIMAKADVDTVVQRQLMQATLKVTTTTLQVYNSASSIHKASAQALVDHLNEECPCREKRPTAKWEVGVERSVDAGECKAPFPDTYWLCWALSQGPVRVAFAGDNNTYARSRFNDTIVKAYSPPVVEYNTRYMGADGNTDKSACEYPLWAECGGTVSQIAQTCKTSSGWEYDNCVLQLMPEPTHCCPCMVRFAEQYDADWLDDICFEN
eukprot:TRINITY_DN8441_c0_g2_i2.p1 TRINITY_DN8441_c0_g2~~TRINITY_DN8441_c0_g2_i2.p1  ORF type:complete len:472 (+),score=94.22 TRINITY_DN8441_c0_g2_i2:35-1450(+)